MQELVPDTRQSSILVAVRVRPFTKEEDARLIPDQGDSLLYLRDSVLSIPSSMPSIEAVNSYEQLRTPSKFRPVGIRKIIDCVDDKMLIFDPSKSNPLNELDESVANITSSNESRRKLRGFGEQKFIFDRIFDTNAGQQEVYENTARPLLDAILDGFNSTVFAYGATGCGKTYTISGTSENPGIVFLTMQELFLKMEQLSDTKTFQLTLSFLEIYNERIHDLLDPSIPSKRLVIREDSQNRTFVSNLSQHTPTNVEEVMDLVIRGNMNRTTSPTDANETSSRSHAVLQVHVAQINKSADLKQDQTFATLSIIDLAGSERASATKNRGARLFEGANINRSLLALGNCINALCVSSTKAGLSCHVPYRDSKLTRLLKFSLGGNCKTVMIVCVSPSSGHYDETLNTLKYANRAKEIKTKVIRNKQSLDRHVSSYLKMITEQKQEIEELRAREQRMISIQVSQYRNGRERVGHCIKEAVRDIRSHLYDSDKIHDAKLTKSLILVKKYYLKLIEHELHNVSQFLATVQQADASALTETIPLILDQIVHKTEELERLFHQPSDIETTTEYMKHAHLKHLQALEHWQGLTDYETFETQLLAVSESVRNEILLNCTRLMEKLVEDPVLRAHFHIISTGLNRGYDNILPTIESELSSLNHVDREFDHFAQLLNSSQRKRSSPRQKQQPSWRQKLVKQHAQRTPLSAAAGSSAAAPPSSLPFHLSASVVWNEPQDVSMMLDDADPVPTEQNLNINTAASLVLTPTAASRRKPKMSLTATQLK